MIWVIRGICSLTLYSIITPLKYHVFENLWKMDQYSKCSIFHNIFKSIQNYIFFKRRLDFCILFSELSPMNNILEKRCFWIFFLNKGLLLMSVNSLWNNYSLTIDSNNVKKKCVKLWTKFQIGHICFIQLFNNQVKQNRKQYTNFSMVQELSGPKNYTCIQISMLYLSFFFLQKNQYINWPISRNDQLEILFTLLYNFSTAQHSLVHGHNPAPPRKLKPETPRC